MKKLAVVASIIWLLVSGLLGFALITLTETKDPAYQIGLQFIAILMAIPIAILFTKALPIETKSPQTPAEEAKKVETGLPLEGVIFGPAFDLPDYFLISYSGAKQSPIIYYHKQHVIVDFGNGKAGIKNNGIYTSPCTDGLVITVKAPGQMFKVG